MNLKLFKHVRTPSELRNRLEILHSVSKEHDVPWSTALKVDVDDFPEMTYVFSDTKNDVILNNYFTYESKDTNLVGLCKVKGGTDKVLNMFDPSYIRFSNLHPLAWLGLGQNSLYDLIVKERVVLRGINDYDIITLGDVVQFIKLLKGSSCYLLCLDHWDVMNGVFAPQNFKDFNDWFSLIISTRGYEGKFDDVLVSDLFRTFFEVKNCIFDLGQFEAINLNI